MRQPARQPSRSNSMPTSTIQNRLATEIVHDAKKMTKAMNAWMIILSDRGKQPRVIKAPKKVQAPFALAPEGLIRYLSEKKKVFLWLPRGQGKFMMGKACDCLALAGNQWKKRLDQDMIWLGGYEKNKALLFLPLVVDQPTRYLLVLERAHWTAGQVGQLALFVRLSARALQVASESRQLEKRMRRSNAISEIAQNINTSLEIEYLLRLIVLEVSKAMNCQAGNIWLLHDQPAKMEMKIAIGLTEKLKENLLASTPDIKGGDWKTGILVETIQSFKDDRAAIFAGTGFKTVLTIPLQTKNKIIGMIQLFSKWSRDALQEEDNLFRTLANLAATVIDNARLFKESQRKAQELLAVYEVGQLVSDTSNMDQALTHMVDRISETLNVEKCWIMFYHQSEKVLRAHPIAIGAVDEQLRALEIGVQQESISAIVFRSGKPMFSNDAREMPVVQEEYEGIFNLHNVMAVPMRGREEILGVILVGNKRKQVLFTGHDVRLFKTLASAAANAVQHAKLYDRLERSNLSMVKVISKMIDAQEPYTRGHSNRVAYYASRLAQEVNCSTSEVEQIRMAGLLHDIGKLGTAENMLLAANERRCRKPHVLIGEQMLQDVDFPWEVNHLVKYHHEHVDGTGSPEGLTADQIPLGARIIAVADTFDVTVSVQDGKEHSSEEGLAALRAAAGTRLDPQLVNVFIKVWPELNKHRID